MAQWVEHDIPVGWMRWTEYVQYEGHSYSNAAIFGVINKFIESNKILKNK